MEIALSVYNDNLSVAFDFADILLLFTVEDGEVKNKKEFVLENINPILRVNEIKKMNVNVLICGCISRCSYELLTESGIEVISHVSGAVEEILSAYLNKKLSNKKFSMPGFGNGKGRAGRCGQKRGFGHGRCRETQINN